MKLDAKHVCTWADLLEYVKSIHPDELNQPVSIYVKIDSFDILEHTHDYAQVDPTLITLHDDCNMIAADELLPVKGRC